MKMFSEVNLQLEGFMFVLKYITVRRLSNVSDSLYYLLLVNLANLEFIPKYMTGSINWQWELIEINNVPLIFMEFNGY